MAQRLTNLLVAATLIAVLFVAFKLDAITNLQAPEGTGQTVSRSGVTTERWVNESLEHWSQRQIEAERAFRN